MGHSIFDNDGVDPEGTKSSLSECWAPRQGEPKIQGYPYWSPRAVCTANEEKTQKEVDNYT
jgi:hypothetical protein